MKGELPELTGTRELGRRKEQGWLSHGHEGGRWARLCCREVPWGSHGHQGGKPQPEGQRVGWDGSQPAAMQTDAFNFFLAVFYSLCWVFRVGLVQLLFHRAAEVGSIGVASFSIELGF